MQSQKHNTKYSTHRFFLRQCLLQLQKHYFSACCVTPGLVSTDEIWGTGHVTLEVLLMASPSAMSTTFSRLSLQIISSADDVARKPTSRHRLPDRASMAKTRVTRTCATCGEKWRQFPCTGLLYTSIFLWGHRALLFSPPLWTVVFLTVFAQVLHK